MCVCVCVCIYEMKNINCLTCLDWLIPKKPSKVQTYK